MKIALLGYGKEGKSVEKYFREHSNDAECDVFENFTYDEIKQRDYSSYDIIFRSPSVPPLGLENESSITKYFFEHCPCPIIGVTATKGKGTTCSFIRALLAAMGEDVCLVGNIGTPAIEVLDDLKPSSVVVYELSSFQLWDVTQSPHVAVIGQLEPDHLNVHRDYAEYLAAKANITKYQTAEDYLVYYAKNSESVKIAEATAAQRVAYPFVIPAEVEQAITLPGVHNIENGMAAIAAVASYLNISPDEYLAKYQDKIIEGLGSFHGLPHRLEFVRELNGVRYFDDNFSTNPSSTRVAMEAFPNDNVVAIVGGRDKTNNQDLAEIYEILKADNIKRAVLIGESGHELARRYHDPKFRVANNLAAAITAARLEAEALGSAVVVMSPAAASFDMFDNVYDRGAKYQEAIKNLN